MEGDWAADVVGDLVGMWTNGVLTHGIFEGEWKGAMWPSLGLPCGTPLLRFKSFVWTPPESNP
jgi:hypothetical protein